MTSPQEHAKQRMKIPVFQSSVIAAKKTGDASAQEEAAGTFDGKKLSRQQSMQSAISQRSITE
jgi:hypothetical protein